MPFKSEHITHLSAPPGTPSLPSSHAGVQSAGGHWGWNMVSTVSAYADGQNTSSFFSISAAG